jgi:hypothetical protein
MIAVAVAATQPRPAMASRGSHVADVFAAEVKLNRSIPIAGSNIEMTQVEMMLARKVVVWVSSSPEVVVAILMSW